MFHENITAYHMILNSIMYCVIDISILGFNKYRQNFSELKDIIFSPTLKYLMTKQSTTMKKKLTNTIWCEK